MGVGYNAASVTDGLVLCLDPANPRSFSPNTFANPLDIYTWYRTKRGNDTGNNCTVSQDLVTDRSPANGIPMKMSVTGNDAHISSYNTAPWNISTATNGQTWTVSFYAKASTTLNNCQVFIFGADSSGVSFVGGSYIGITSKTITVTPEWQRFEHFITFNNASIAYIQMRLDGPDANGSGTTVWWDGLQVERNATATTFNGRTNANRSNISNLIDNSNSTIYNYPIFTQQQLVFDGISQYLSIPNTNYPSAVTDPFSMEMMLYVPTEATWSDGTYDGSIFTRGSYAGSHGFIRKVQDNTIGFWVRGDTGLGNAIGTLTRNTWYHCMGTWDGAQAKLYINGSLIDTEALSLSGSFESNVWYVGSIQGMSGAAGNRFQGSASKSTIYNRALTASEVQQNFNAIRGRFGI